MIRFKELLTEALTKKPMTFYHGTESQPFDKYSADNAAKGEQFWNPLGQGLYCTDNKELAHEFGGNVYAVDIPIGANYRVINKDAWDSYATNTARTCMMKALGGKGDARDYFDKIKRPEFTFDLPKHIEGNSPYQGLVEASAFFNTYYPDKTEAFEDLLAATINKHLKKYDFVIFPSTEFYQQAKEIVVFNPALQRARPLAKGE